MKTRRYFIKGIKGKNKNKYWSRSKGLEFVAFLKLKNKRWNRRLNSSKTLL